MAVKRSGPLGEESIPYRGWLIKSDFFRAWYYITKGGVSVGAEPSLEAAKRTVDMLEGK